MNDNQVQNPVDRKHVFFLYEIDLCDYQFY